MVLMSAVQMNRDQVFHLTTAAAGLEFVQKSGQPRNTMFHSENLMCLWWSAVVGAD
jgi:hypothetical protein